MHYMGIEGGEEPETFRVLSDPGHSLATELFWGFSPVSPHKFPYTVPSPVCSHSKTQWGARNPGLRQPAAPAKPIPALHHCLCPQPHTPVHPLAPPALPSRSLGNAPIHTTATAPTSITIITPLQWPLQPLALEHHPATLQPAGLQQHATRGSRGVEMRCGAMQKGSGGNHCRHFGVERVCSPSWVARAPYNFVV